MKMPAAEKQWQQKNYMREITLVISLHTAAISCGTERKSLKEMLDSISFKQHRRRKRHQC